MEEMLYAVGSLVEVLRDIAKQTRYTYLQGNEHEPTLRIDNQTGQAWRLVSNWDSTTMETTVKWEPWQITVDEPSAEPVSEPMPVQATTYHCVECNTDFQPDTDAYPEKCPACGRSAWDLPF